MFNNSPLPYALIFLSVLISTVFIESRLIPVFKKNAKQPIYEGGPSWHIKKSGTPTMGGIGFLIPVVLVGLLFCVPIHLSGNRSGAVSLLISLLFALLNAGIGLLDDITKLHKKENQGLTAKEKFFLQTVLVILFLAARAIFLNSGTSISFVFGTLELGMLYYPLSAFIILGIINCANLTDGVDGLASCVAFAAGISSFYIAYPLYSDAAVISASLIGATVGFLCFNLHPAKIFMGDTGSLFLGALVASLATSLGNPLISVGIGGVYVIEGVSVILQVAIFKLTKKRLFKMAPLHHHLEKSGWSENKICITAILTTLLTSLLTTALFAI